MQEDWEGFGIRLGRAIDKWPGGGQRKFAVELAAHARRVGATVPTSYRTLINYLQGKTRPSAAWVDVAAQVLQTTPEFLTSGVEKERDSWSRYSGLNHVFTAAPEDVPRVRALVALVLNKNMHLPMPARQLMFHFAMDYFGGDTEGWENWEWVGDPRQKEVAAMLQDYFGPLLVYRPMGETELMGLASSLAAAAYLQLAASRSSRKS